jgi:uncharacterized pyridoxamine 5'-phosphate oxidase family protein
MKVLPFISPLSMSVALEIAAFLSATPAFHVATVDADGRPRNRPFGLAINYEGHLLFATGGKKKIYAELQKTPYVEISSFNPSTGQWIRVHGEVKWLDDLAAKKKVFEVMPQLAPIYESPENPDFKIFYVVGKADFYGTGEPNARPSRSFEIN